jgi:hypothetical protein
MKLSNGKLIELLKALLQNEEIGHTLIEGVSSAQANNFKRVFMGESETPLYMEAFMVLYDNTGKNIDKLKESLESLQDDVKPISGGSMNIIEPDYLSGSKFVFTSAQNNTDVHENFLKSLKTYCKINNAELHIGKFIYNKNGFQNGVMESDEIYFDNKLTQFFNTEKSNICKGLTWCGDLNILPTAKNPLTGFETYTGNNSGIVPHAKIALESIATPKNSEAKMMYATGCITKRNYIQKKAGQVAQHAHCYGAVVVEVGKNGNYFVRQIQTDDTGIFQDLNTVYTPEGKTKQGKISAINWGDLHAEKSDNKVLKSCYKMLDELEPKKQLFHDTFDMTARNHHNRKSGHFLAEMHFSGRESVSRDIRQAASVLNGFHRGNSKLVLVESNHDLALESWLNANDYDFRADPINSLTYLKLQTAIYEALENKSKINILEFALKNIGSLANFNYFTFLTTDDSYIINGIECGMHGHIGANGSRGSPNQFTKLNMPLNTGHTHSCSIKGNVYTAGVTGSLDMGYNKGASSWSHSHILTYPNGFRTIVTMRKTSSGLWEYKAK